MQCVCLEEKPARIERKGRATGIKERDRLDDAAIRLSAAHAVDTLFELLADLALTSLALVKAHEPRSRREAKVLGGRSQDV